VSYSLYDLIGNIGVTFIIISYLLLLLDKISSSSFKFSFFNAAGALLIIISLLQQFNLSAFIIEAFWLVISLVGLVRFLLKRRNNL
jgi:predicted membrane protein